MTCLLKLTSVCTDDLEAPRDYETSQWRVTGKTADTFQASFHPKDEGSISLRNGVASQTTVMFTHTTVPMSHTRCA